MKTKKLFLPRFLTLLFMACIGVESYATEIYKLDFSSATKGDGFPTSSTSTIDTGSFSCNGVTWTASVVSSTGTCYWNWTSTGLQMGSSGNWNTSISIATSDFSETSSSELYAGTKISKIIVNSKGASGTNAELSVSVGGTSLTYSGDGSNIVVITSAAKDYEFTCEEAVTGDITIHYSQSAAGKAVYLESIEVYDADTHINPQLSYAVSLFGCDTDEIAAGTVVLPELSYIEGFNGMDEIEYSSSNEGVATVTDGKITFTGATGETTVTAKFPGNDRYFASEASYTVLVKAPLTFDFEIHTYGMTVYTGTTNVYETKVTELAGKNDVRLVFGGTGNYRMWDNEGTHLRVYNGETFTVIAPDGWTISGITIYGTPTGDGLTNLTVDTGTFSAADHTGVWTSEETAKSVTFTTASGNSTYQEHISAIDVALQSAATGSFTISFDEGYATYYTNVSYVMPAGITGTAVTGVMENGTTLNTNWEYAEGSVVPARTALLLKGAKGTYNYTIVAADEEQESAADNANLLCGSAVKTVTKGLDSGTTYKYYKLSHNAEGKNLGFYYGEEEGGAFESQAGKAWLAIDIEQAGEAKTFLFGGGETTGIQPVASGITAKSGIIYNLQGIRAGNMPKKGIYVKDGKKIIIR